ncbi:MAG: universal stress protein [Planctomycetes bacterium]|nr:universal stress protein [Planctomycetota bacterium]
MDHVENLVVGIDFSVQSQRALEEAIRIARWSQAKVHIIHVIDAPTAEDIADLAGVVGINDVADFAHAHVVDFAQTVADLNLLTQESGLGRVPAEVQVRVGHPYSELAACARQTDADFLVLGASGAGEAAAGLGTLATKCVRKAPPAVLLVRGGQRGPFRRIVAAVDHSSLSQRVVDQALRMACQDDARLDVLHVYQPPWEMAPYWPRSDVPGEVRERCVSALEAKMAALITPFEPEMRYVHAESRTLAAQDCKQGIVEFVRGVQADLVVLGARGRTQDGGFSIGTTTESIVRDAPCSVLVLKAETAERRNAAGSPKGAARRRTHPKGLHR